MRSTTPGQAHRTPSARTPSIGGTSGLLAAAEDVLFWLRVAVWNRVFDSFDRRHGTMTSGEVSLKRLDLFQPLARYGMRYQPIDAGIFRAAIRRLPSEVVPGQFTFVDLGCGKGRALILAQETGFRDILGVEISPALADSTRWNLEQAGISNARAVCGNAGAIQFPAGNLVVYLFHPFSGPVFRRTMQNLCRTSTGNVWLLYVNPAEKAALEEKPCFKLWEGCASFSIYSHRPHPNQ